MIVQRQTSRHRKTRGRATTGAVGRDGSSYHTKEETFPRWHRRDRYELGSSGETVTFIVAQIVG